MGLLPALTLVIGGAASGKSDFAETLVIEHGGPRFYLATGQAFDDEMARKISAHKAARSDKGWTTVEAPTDLASALSDLQPDGVALIDCATLWLTNLMMADADTEAEIEQLARVCRARQAPVVIVSNEVGQGIVPQNAMARRFRGLQGSFNRAYAAQADLVVQVIAGLPRVLKGERP